MSLFLRHFLFVAEHFFGLTAGASGAVGTTIAGRGGLVWPETPPQGVCCVRNSTHKNHYGQDLLDHVVGVQKNILPIWYVKKATTHAVAVV